MNSGTVFEFLDLFQQKQSLKSLIIDPEIGIIVVNQDTFETKCIVTIVSSAEMEIKPKIAGFLRKCQVSEMVS